MNLIGEIVIHKKFGTGRVVKQRNKNISVEFATKTRIFPYPDLNTFTKFLTAEDLTVQAVILQEIADAQAEIEAQKRAEEELKYQVAGEARKYAEEQRTIEIAKNTSACTFSVPKKVAAKRERIPGKRMTFFVFQGNTYDCESRGGYIWAPISNKAGNTFHYWDRLLDIHYGDIILHGCDGYIKAVSTAKGKCYDCNRPEDHRSEEMWDQEGRRVDCEYIPIKRPIKTSVFADDIVRLCSVKYAPFDKYGNGNMGYLYELNRELACIFLRSSAKYNDYLNDVNYIREFLEAEVAD